MGNAAPFAAPEPVRVPRTGGPVIIDVLGNDVDADGGTLTIVSVTQPEHGTVAVVDGQPLFTPEAGWTGPVSFTYTVSDGQGCLATAAVNLDVVGGPDTSGPGGLPPCRRCRTPCHRTQGLATLRRRNPFSRG